MLNERKVLNSNFLDESTIQFPNFLKKLKGCNLAHETVENNVLFADTINNFQALQFFTRLKKT